MAKLFRAVIMGPPGSGKGTISERIAKSFGLLHLSSGDFLRENIAANTGTLMSPPQFSELMQQCFNSQGINKFRQEAGVLAQTYIERGLLVPDHVITRLLLPRVEQMTSHSWLLDGFPRTMAQAQALNSSCELDVVINLNIPFETLKERLSDRWVHTASGRVYNMGFNPPRVKGKDDISGEPLIQYDDDKPKALVARLRHYKDVAKPVIDLYKEKGILHSFSGTETDKIWPYISSLLSTKIQTQQTDVLRAPIP